jgi:hypothetical protein
VRAFNCGNCGQLVFFENNLCLRCSTPLGFVPSTLQLVALTEETVEDRGLRRCENAALAQCNWMLEAPDPGPLCRSCRLTRTRPGDNDAEGLAAFAEAEAAKRRLLFGLFNLGLEVDEGRLRFDLLSSRSGPVVTGHKDGVVTIDLVESDDARRERPDERLDYDEALRRHYEGGPPPDWSNHHVSSYAAAHPWEDWAETFAHHLHIRDTLETAAAYGLVVTGPPAADDDSLTAAPAPDAGEGSFDAIVRDWLPLTYALNAINRSMGRDALYPFTLAPKVIGKLAYVHDRVQSAGGRAP